MAFSEDCNHPISINVTIQAGLASGVPGVICLLLSVVGLVAELWFVCRKKNNFFLLRLFIYLTVAVIISQALFSLWLFVFAYPHSALCAILDGLINYPTLVQFLFKISINVVLLYKVYVSTCYRSRQRWYPKYPKTLECILVLSNFGIPMVIVAALLGAAGDPIYWPSSRECYIIRQMDCKTKGHYFSLMNIIPEYIPALIELLLDVVCIGTLLLWLSWVQSKNFLQARTRTVMQEIIPLLGFLMAYFSLRIFLETLNTFTVHHTAVMLTTFVIYPINHAVPPICLLIYVCIVSLCKWRKKEHQLPFSTQQQTAPPSDRVSLPADTAAHAPNFLSPSTAANTSLRESFELLAHVN